MIFTTTLVEKMSGNFAVPGFKYFCWPDLSSHCECGVKARCWLFSGFFFGGRSWFMAEFWASAIRLKEGGYRLYSPRREGNLNSWFPFFKFYVLGEIFVGYQGMWIVKIWKISIGNGENVIPRKRKKKVQNGRRLGIRKCTAYRKRMGWFMEFYKKFCEIF